MKNSKITKILPLALALSLSIGCAQAAIDGQDETGNNTAQIQYSLDLQDYVKITQKDGVTTVDGNYSNDYAGLNLSNQLSANFKVITNISSSTIFICLFICCSAIYSTSFKF